MRGNLCQQAVKLEFVNEIFNQIPIAPQQEFSQEFRYRRVVGTILAIVLLAAAVTGAAIGLSSRTGDNSEEAVVQQDGSDSAADDAETSNSASGRQANDHPDVQSDTPTGVQSNGIAGSDLFPLPEFGENTEIAGSASTQIQTLNLAQNTIEGGSSRSISEGAAPSSLSEAVAKLLPSSVAIYVKNDESGEEDGYSSAGSGIIIDDSGLVLSAAHVFTDGNGDHITTDQIIIELNNGFFANGTLLGYDTGVDVAVIRFDPSNLDFRAADLADMSDLVVGDQVLAIGAPFGYVNSVNVGYVSGIYRTEFLILDEERPASVPTIQTDAPINSGNSGGMLANTDGEVLGVNVFIRTTGSSIAANAGNVGLGFAVPIDIAMRVANKILAGEQFLYGALGVVGTFVLEAGAPGPSIVTVVPGQSADLAGIEVGDHVIEFEGKKVRTMNDLASFVQFHSPGEYASIVLYRNNQEVRVTATIGTSSKESLTTIIS